MAAIRFPVEGMVPGGEDRTTRSTVTTKRVFSPGFTAFHAGGYCPHAPAAPAQSARGRRGGRGTREGSQHRRGERGEAELRAQWRRYHRVSTHGTLYRAYQFVLRSTTRGDSWKRSVGPTTNNSRDLLKSSSAGVSAIVALAESQEAGLLDAGTDDGRLQSRRTAARMERPDRRAVTKGVSRVVPRSTLKAPCT